MIASGVGTMMHNLLVAAVLVQFALWGNMVITHVVSRSSEHGKGTVAALGVVARAIFWLILVLLGLENAGIHVTALVAGLGVGGVAVALAVQNILGDLFASLSIVLDKPFEPGDFIIVGEMMGTVENVGLKTTRLRSLSGEQLVFSNADLLGSRIRNYKRMQERRAVFNFGVTYDTAPTKVAEIPDMVRSIIQAQSLARFDRAHFKSYGASSLDFEVVYYVLNPDYNRYMDLQQDINLSLLRRFADEEIEFAFPTQTLHVNTYSAAWERR